MVNIVLIDSISDFNVMPQELFKNKNIKFFSLSLEVHERLRSDKITHDIADEILTNEERLKLFDKNLEFFSLYLQISPDDLKFEGVNLLQIFDTVEFYSYLMSNLVKMLTIKRIIEKEKPTKIICTSSLSNIVKSIIKTDNVKTEFLQNIIEQKLLWDTITIKYNLGPIPISLNLSKNNYLKIKKLTESILGFFYNFWIDRNSPKRKSIVILEFNPEYFSTFFHAMKNYDGNVILINRRRSAVWSMTSINIIKKSNCKVLNFDNILSKDEKREMHLLLEEYTKKIEKFWENSKIFTDIFQIENCSFWNVIKEVIMKKYSEKLSEFLLLILSAKNIFQNMDVRCIISLNEMGETEKSFLEFNNKKIPSILLEHGFVERIDDTKRFDKLLPIDFKYKIAVWGNKKKEYLIHEYGITPDRIIVTGSPRHDIYFNSRIEKNQSQEITVLIAPNPITELSGLASINLELKFENTIKDIISILKKLDNVKIIVKLHQIQLKHNHKIPSLIKKIDNTIPIYSSVPVIETINNADIIIVISPESFGTSTILLESMILGKPTMNIVLDDKIPIFTHVKDKAVLTISNNSDLEENLKKILFDNDFRKELTKNADAFVEKFMSYRGNASKKFASILKSF